MQKNLKVFHLKKPKAILYLGENLVGTTSSHRRFLISELCGSEVINVDFNSYLPKTRLMKSCTWRLHNYLRLRPFEQAILSAIHEKNFDLIWIDKGMFLTVDLIQCLRGRTETLVFFTPDCFFLKNNVLAIQKSLSLFDAVVTTKSFEIEDYLKYIVEDQLILVNQGYTEGTGAIGNDFEDRDLDVLFIGKCELHRVEIVEYLAKNNIGVAVGGAGWRFKMKRLSKLGVRYLGADFRGVEYQRAFERGKIGLGLLSKEFPETHTTRTLEIPYFGCAMATERNQETEAFFASDEVFFYDTPEDLLQVVKESFRTNSWKEVAKKGQLKILQSSFSWRAQIESVLSSLRSKPGNS